MHDEHTPERRQVRHGGWRKCENGGRDVERCERIIVERDHKDRILEYEDWWSHPVVGRTPPRLGDKFPGDDVGSRHAPGKVLAKGDRWNRP